MVDMEYLVAGSATPAQRAGVATAIGRHRERNEDASLCGPSWYVVADGVGGRLGGDIASRMTVDSFAERSAPRSTEEIATALAQVNLAIRERARAIGVQGMASTVAGAVEVDGVVMVFHVGDSRCYHLVDGRLGVLTRDHSYVSELVDAGRITAAEADYHRRRNIITRALGADGSVCPDVRSIVGSVGRLLLCTDGVSSVVTSDEIARILAVRSHPQFVAELLVETAVANGATDDATVVVVDGSPDR